MHKDLIGSMLLAQYIINMAADQLVRPEVGMIEHQKVGLRSALLLYIKMFEDDDGKG